MSHYHHLSTIERESLWEMHLLGYSLRAIAKALGRSASTISREIKRNSEKECYRPSCAEKKYQKRRKSCHRTRLLENTPLAEVVRHLLESYQWSPEQISKRLYAEQGITISYNTIYRALARGIMERKGERKRDKGTGRYKLQKHLRRKNRPNGGHKKRSLHKELPKIHQRPQEANERLEIGHLEGDTVYCSMSKTSFITMVDRKSRFLWTACCQSKGEEDMEKAMTKVLSQLPEGILKSVTLDRGSEFLCYTQVSKNLGGVPFFFADPRSPWQRGTNENTNGLLRQYVPKHTYKVPFSEELLRTFTLKLNLRPRKCLGWKTPFEVFFGKVLHLT